jgi:hypothetical protein
MIVRRAVQERESPFSLTGDDRGGLKNLVNCGSVPLMR